MGADRRRGEGEQKKGIQKTIKMSVNRKRGICAGRKG
jgi:hypothetical protein